VVRVRFRVRVNLFSVGAERDRVNRSRMPRNTEFFHPTLCVPDPYGLVPLRSGSGSGSGSEGEGEGQRVRVRVRVRGSGSGSGSGSRSGSGSGSGSEPEPGSG
jgi:hypothetical protein